MIPVGVALFILGFVVSVPFELMPGILGGAVSGVGLACIAIGLGIIK